MAADRIAVIGTRALALVRVGDTVRWERGFVMQGSSNTLAETAGVSRLFDKVQLQSTVGNITSRVTQKTLVNGLPVGLFYSGVTGPRIIKGWIIDSVRTVWAG